MTLSSLNAFYFGRRVRDHVTRRSPYIRAEATTIITSSRTRVVVLSSRTTRHVAIGRSNIRTIICDRS